MDRQQDLYKHSHLKYKICVSGAAETSHCGREALEKAKELGLEVARQNGILLSGATTGFPFWTAMGAKEAGGITIGFSPAGSEREHVDIYRLPVDYLDLIVYTGFGYPGRDLILTKASDAVVVACGRIGTIHEFTIAFEENKPIGVLEGKWKTDETIRTIIERGHRPSENIVFDSDPHRLVAKLIQKIHACKAKEHRLI